MTCTVVHQSVEGTTRLRSQLATAKQVIKYSTHMLRMSPLLLSTEAAHVLGYGFEFLRMLEM